MISLVARLGAISYAVCLGNGPVRSVLTSVGLPWAAVATPTPLGTFGVASLLYDWGQKHGIACGHAMYSAMKRKDHHILNRLLYRR
jgi:hypothetical protein